jgi:hypothetical protein
LAELFKANPFDVLGAVWVQGGGPGGERRVGLGQIVRLGRERANMAAWAAWMRVVCGAGGATEGSEHQGTSLAQSLYWPTAAAVADVVSSSVDRICGGVHRLKAVLLCSFVVCLVVVGWCVNA